MKASFDLPAESTRCPTCDAPLDSHATICAACGAPLAIANVPRPAPDVPDMPGVPGVPGVPIEAMPVPVEPIVPAFAVPVPPQPAGAELPAEKPAQAMPPVAPAPPGTYQRRCEWCGAESPLGAERCVRCHAMFPRPDQDEAMRRAGEARIQAAEEEIALRQRARHWYSRGKRSGP